MGDQHGGQEKPCRSDWIAHLWHYCCVLNMDLKSKIFQGLSSLSVVYDLSNHCSSRKPICDQLSCLIWKYRTPSTYLFPGDSLVGNSNNQRAASFHYGLWSININFLMRWWAVKFQAYLVQYGELREVPMGLLRQHRRRISKSLLESKRQTGKRLSGAYIRVSNWHISRWSNCEGFHLERWKQK